MEGAGLVEPAPSDIYTTSKEELESMTLRELKVLIATLVSDVDVEAPQSKEEAVHMLLASRL